MSATIIERLTAARRDRGEVSLEGAPTRLDEAYPISAGVMKALGESVGGWKVGHDPASGTPMGAPMFASGFVKSGARFALKPGRPMIPEVEIAARLARDLPRRAGAPWTRADVLDASSELLLGLELIERRIPPKGAPFALNLADDLGNIGYVVGPAIRDFRNLDLARLRCRFWMGDELVNDREGGHSKGDPLTPMIDWANHRCDLVGGMKSGQVVTLGSLTPMRAMEAPARLRAELEGFGEVTLDVVAG
jgi:2-keto-4-pentenoate hydratase